MRRSATPTPRPAARNDRTAGSRQPAGGLGGESPNGEPRGSEPLGPEPRGPEPRQRWRVAFARDGGGDGLAARDLVAALVLALRDAGLPLAVGPRAKQPVVLAAPLPAAMTAEHEVADVVLGDRLPVWRVRDAVAAALPPGYRLVALEDVWLGAPALAGSVVGAVYRTVLDASADPGADAIDGAARELMRARELPRTREKGSGAVRYDLRPLLASVDVVDPGPPTVVRIATRFDPERGAGRPEEVLAAIGDRLGRPIVAATTVRERVLLTDDVARAIEAGLPVRPRAQAAASASRGRK